MPEILYHFHVCWKDNHPDPQSHVLCLTAANKAHAVRETGRYIGDSLGSVGKVTYKGDAASYIMCSGAD